MSHGLESCDGGGARLDGVAKLSFTLVGFVLGAVNHHRFWRSQLGPQPVRYRCTAVDQREDAARPVADRFGVDRLALSCG